MNAGLLSMPVLGWDRKVEIFTSSGMWVRDTKAIAYKIEGVGGGGGGGGGACRNASGIRYGGAGGAGGAYATGFFWATFFNGDSIAITVGAGGIGGAGRTTVGAAGGGDGGDTLFGTFLTCNGGSGGPIAVVSGFTPQPANAGFYAGGGTPGSTTSTIITGSTYSWPAHILAGGSGGVGGSILADNVTYYAAKPGGDSIGFSATYAGGAAGANGASPTAGSNGTDSIDGYGGSGGGGGGGADSGAGAAANGGAGGLYGGGGGGGGESTTGFLSGSGGNGAPGILIITTYYAI